MCSLMSVSLAKWFAPVLRYHADYPKAETVVVVLRAELLAVGGTAILAVVVPGTAARDPLGPPGGAGGVFSLAGVVVTVPVGTTPAGCRACHTGPRRSACTNPPGSFSG